MWWRKCLYSGQVKQSKRRAGQKYCWIGKTCKEKFPGQDLCTSFPQSFGAKEFEEMVT